MASFDTWAEIRLDALDRAEEETGASVSEFYALAGRAGDRAYHDLLGRHPFLFSKARRPLILQAKGNITATITWTTATQAVTLAVAIAYSLVGWKIKHPTRNEVYRIVAHVPGATAVTTEAPLQGSTITSTSATLFKDEYDLAELQEVPTAPTGALAGLGAGNVNTGAHQYRVTFVSANGETEAGAASSVVTTTSGDGQVSVSAIPTGPPGTLARRLYRTKAGATVYYALATIGDNLTTTYADNTADASLGTDEAPTINRTCGVRHITGLWCPETGGEIEGPITEEEIHRDYGDPPSGAWPPSKYARLTEDRIRFSQYPSQNGLIEIAHTFVPRDLSVCQPWEIVVPRLWRWSLSDGTLYFLYVMKHDDRAAEAGARWEKAIADLISEDNLKKLGLEGSRRRTIREPVGR